MKIGYARTSTVDQIAGLNAQVRELEAVGCDRLFHERVSSVAKRDQLEAALDWCREGDSLVVTKLDRLARSMADLMKIIERLDQKKVGLVVIGLALDTSKPEGRLMLNIFGSVAQFEREIMLERQREGIAKAQAEGKFKGRVPTAARKIDQIRAMKAEGKTVKQISEATGVSRSSIFRLLSDEGPRVQ